MNYGGDAADQIVRYSLDGMDHGLRLSGTIAKNLAVFFVAILKDQKKSYGKTKMIRMLKENRPLKFFTVPTERLTEFCKEGKKRGLLYVIIKDKKNPSQSEVMVFADDAAKVNRVLDKMNLDFLDVERGAAVHEVVGEPTAGVQENVQTETVQLPEGEVQFELSDFEEAFNLAEPEEAGNFTSAQESGEKNLSEPSLRSNDTLNEKNDASERPSVKKELEEIKKEKQLEKKNGEKQKEGPRRASNKSKKKQRGR